ncbi:TetR/AcrR family transcriptional regulator [Mycolicibacterium sp. P1-18]|uniref:TetR/AcrR family transcriptional regulator n=1 Tax=Mycolicibacterium sp. P1-18 TaxID=2024615 RepID=UPI0011F3E561|nr:TetR/AcrR family transcriptional regulator [Mycolicibacterium sp. P1-18]KAA0096222.1 TetR/AcrR family transcriptional regulator [Mycolicibacterium sp. P1-18]
MVEPDAVAVAHRRRLLDALDESIRENGYANTTVADIVRRARASRRTFYQHFPDREAALVALLTDTNKSTVRAIATAVDPAEPWQAQIRQAITAWIARSESHPALTLSWIRDVPALGTAARSLQRDAMDGFITLVQTLSNTAELRQAGIEPVPQARAIMLIGGLRELTAITVESGGQLSDVAEEAVESAIALLRPRP